MSVLMDTLLTDTQRLMERRARPAPPVPASRADQIIAEGDRRRVAYRCANPDADTTMVFGAQVGYLHGMVRSLCHEAEALNITRDKNLQSCASTDDGAHEPAQSVTINNRAGLLALRAAIDEALKDSGSATGEGA